MLLGPLSTIHEPVCVCGGGVCGAGGGKEAGIPKQRVRCR